MSFYSDDNFISHPASRLLSLSFFLSSFFLYRLKPFSMLCLYDSIVLLALKKSLDLEAFLLRLALFIDRVIAKDSMTLQG